MPFPHPTNPLSILDLTGQDGEFWRHPLGSDELGCYRAVVDALPARRFARGLEIGCGTGTLTRYLASNCDTLLALDPNEASVHLAEMRCEDQPWVQFAFTDLRREWPDTGFNLIVVHDALRWLSPADCRLLPARALAALGPDGAIVLLTKRRNPEADEAADLFCGDCRPRLSLAARECREHCRIDVLT